MANKVKKGGANNALVADGPALADVLADSALVDAFLAVAMRCRSTICCRVTPLQKALVVSVVRTRLRKVTLAIGDGSNDVSMIQTAHVGVGIHGMEGSQAVRASDYSFAQFKSLRILLAVHGRYSYYGICNLVNYSFFKNACLATVMFLYGFQTGAAGTGPAYRGFGSFVIQGQTLYSPWLLSAWNVFITSVPPLVMACCDRDVPERKIHEYPELFQEVKGGLYWSVRTIVGWTASALWSAAVVYTTLTLTLGEEATFHEGGETWDVEDSSSLAAWLTFSVVGSFYLLANRRLISLHGLAMLLSLFCLVAVSQGLEIFGDLRDGENARLASSPLTYLLVLIAVVLSLLPAWTFI
ncbi:MAG: hypothetical protein BJ554DRAFT_4179 [Olpidium bornovanus]|uniref:P-type ATPase C-terminal domain-containing protein n=1 Tax=Olpidium bornovanus TaxID=278681 RepID=A0A8H8DEZ3_9FUNG|nr:MAG: hypothetical protein BJ554DRAFT_4179 [Olpidium bornovanus]